MNLHRLLPLALVVLGSPLAAERLQFDHRLYPPLQQVLDSGETDKVDFNADNPRRLVDLIAVKGASAREWREALEIVSIPRPRDVASAHAWMEILQKKALHQCQATFTILAEDATSVTFERRSPGCAAERASFGLYKLVAGKRSWFELAVLARDGLNDAARAQWLALLASAHID